MFNYETLFFNMKVTGEYKVKVTSGRRRSAEILVSVDGERQGAGRPVPWSRDL